MEESTDTTATPTPEADRPAPEPIQRKRRRWGRGRPGEPVEGAPYVAAPALPMTSGSVDRFAPVRLGPTEEPRERFAFIRPAVEALPRVRKSSWLRPSTALDRALLVIEVMGALVVAWVVWQYIYTVYFDTAPRRVTTSRGAISLATRTPLGSEAAGLAATATPTRFAEVLPPLVGEPDGGAMTGGPPQTPTATPTVDAQILLPSRLRIPVMFLDSPVHEVKLNLGEWEVSALDVGHHEGTGLPGQTGNVVLAGHRDINSALFRELDRLQPGDEVFVNNGVGEYRYVVQESLVVSPSQVEVMAPTEDKRLTLITCTPVGLATQRLVVVAVLDETSGAAR